MYETLPSPSLLLGMKVGITHGNTYKPNANDAKM